MIISRSSLLHLRIPFSFLLLPIFLFSLSLSPNINPDRILIVFICLHFLLYPATNGFNSYFDKDEESIGGLKNPPVVTRDLLILSLLLDLAAILLALKISILFAGFLFIYGLVSKVYSHPRIRLKKFPWLSWITAGFFQGAFTFWACYVGINDFSLSMVLRWEIIIPGLLTTLLLLANYPLTQIYQHREDARRGDMTLSRLLGIKGTFIFSAIIFTLAAIMWFIYLQNSFSQKYAWFFLLALSFPMIFFIYWLYQYRNSPNAVNYSNTMRLSWISATALNIFFVYLFLDYTQVIQALKGGF